MKNINDKETYLTKIVPNRLELNGTQADLTIGPCDKQALRVLLAGAQRFDIHQQAGSWVVVKIMAGGKYGGLLTVFPQDVTVAPHSGTIHSLTLWHQPFVGPRRKACARPASLVTLASTANSTEPTPGALPADGMTYAFTSTEIEQVDFTRFLQEFGPERLPDGPKLAALRGKVTFHIDGYHDDQRELWEIPEVRSFYQAWWKAWPYALYFGDLDNKALLIIFLCCLDSVRAVKNDGEPFGHVYFQLGEMNDFVKRSLPPLVNLEIRTGASYLETTARLEAVRNYLVKPSVVSSHS